MSIFPTMILLATDGSEDATLAASAAVDISRGTDSEVHVVHVLPRFPEGVYPGITQELYSYVLDETYGKARRLLDEQAKLIESSGGTVTESHLKRGRLVNEILDLAQEIGVGLIVMGSQGLGSMRRALMGSVSDSVVRHAHCPVLVLCEEKRLPALPFRRGLPTLLMPPPHRLVQRVVMVVEKLVLVVSKVNLLFSSSES